MSQPTGDRISDVRKTIDTLLQEGQTLFDQAAERGKDIERNEEIYRQLGMTGDIGARAKAKEAFDGLRKRRRAALHVALATEQSEILKRIESTYSQVQQLVVNVRLCLEDAANADVRSGPYLDAFEALARDLPSLDILHPAAVRPFLIEVRKTLFLVQRHLEGPLETTARIAGIREPNSVAPDDSTDGLGSQSEISPSVRGAVVTGSSSKLSAKEKKVLEAVGEESFRTLTNPAIQKLHKTPLGPILGGKPSNSWRCCLNRIRRKRGFPPSGSATKK